MSMIEEILIKAAATEPNKQVTSNHLPDSQASLRYALLRVRYLLYDIAIDLGMSKRYSLEEINDALCYEIFIDQDEVNLVL